MATSTTTAGEPGVGGGRPPIVAHHFNNLRQQQATVRFGMWLFLVTEVLFFGGIFCAYTVYRIWYPREFEAGSTALNPVIAGINSFLLLTSSLTCTLAIRAAYTGLQGQLRLWLALTFLLGLTFLGFKAYEYYEDIHEGLIPGTRTLTVEAEKHVAAMTPFERERAVPFAENLKVVLDHKGYDYKGRKIDLHRVQLFFMFYYCMTGLHVVHMVVGIGLFIYQFALAGRGFFVPAERYVYVEVLALYWHLVDMVWMFLMPLLYLGGVYGMTASH